MKATQRIILSLTYQLDAALQKRAASVQATTHLQACTLERDTALVELARMREKHEQAQADIQRLTQISMAAIEELTKAQCERDEARERAQLTDAAASRHMSELYELRGLCPTLAECPRLFVGGDFGEQQAVENLRDCCRKTDGDFLASIDATVSLLRIAREERDTAIKERDEAVERARLAVAHCEEVQADCKARLDSSRSGILQLAAEIKALHEVLKATMVGK